VARIAFERLWKPITAKFPGARVGIAGSIRRKKAMVGDVDMVCVAIPGIQSFARSLLASVEAEGTDFIRGHMEDETLGTIPVQFWFCTLAAWGATILQVTGPREFNVWLRLIAKHRGMLLNNEGLWGAKDQKPVLGPAPREDEIIYALLGVRALAPERRFGPDDEKYAALKRQYDVGGDAQ
jgi:DNA polymerase/3'-5' exonuclease PolX